MPYEGLSWPNSPTATDLNDGDQAYSMGIKFGLVTTAANCVGVRWRVPDTVVNPQGFSHNVSLWAVVGEVRLANIDFTPVPGADMDILFSTPVALSLSTEYVVAVYTNHYVFSSPTPSSSWHIYSPSGNVDAYEAKLAAGNSGPNLYPASNFNGWYYVGPLIQTAGGLSSAAPSGQAVPVNLGGHTATLGLSTAPTGLAAAVALGQPTAALNRSAAPSGLAIPVVAGQPALGPAGAAPSGLAIPVATGQPVAALSRLATPSGLAIPVATGQPAVGPAGVLPTGLATAVTLGQPAVSLARSAAPTGLTISMTIGQPSTLPPATTESPNRPIVVGGGQRVIVASSGGRAVTR